MPRKRAQKAALKSPIVMFEFEERTYQIDPGRRKVYRRFVEIETAKAALIISSWRSQQAVA